MRQSKTQAKVDSQHWEHNSGCAFKKRKMESINARTSDLDKGRTSPTIKIQTTAAMRPHCSDPAGSASYLSERGRMSDARQNSSGIEIE